jgi:hypothetical protein
MYSIPQQLGKINFVFHPNFPTFILCKTTPQSGQASVCEAPVITALSGCSWMGEQVRMRGTGMASRGKSEMMR